MWQGKCRKTPREKAIAAIVRGQQGDAGSHGVKCFICQKQGHTKQECTVEKSKLYCQHCKQRGIHNTNCFCRAFKSNPDNKDKTKKGKINLVTKRKSTRPGLSATQKRKKRSLRRLTRMRTQTPPPYLSAGSNGGHWRRLTLRGSSTLPMNLRSSFLTRSSRQKTTHLRMSLGTIPHQILQQRRKSHY